MNSKEGSRPCYCLNILWAHQRNWERANHIFIFLFNCHFSSLLPYRGDQCQVQHFYWAWRSSWWFFIYWRKVSLWKRMGKVIYPIGIHPVRLDRCFTISTPKYRKAVLIIILVFFFWSTWNCYFSPRLWLKNELIWFFTCETQFLMAFK